MENRYQAYIESVLEKIPKPETSNRSRKRKYINSVIRKKDVNSLDANATTDEPNPKHKKPNTENKYVSYINQVLTSVTNSKNELVLTEIETAFKRRMFTFGIVNIHKILDPKHFFQKTQNLIETKVNEIRLISPIKVQISLVCEMLLPKTEEIKTIYINSKYSVIYQTSNISEWYNGAMKIILGRLAEYQERDSGWALHKVMQLNLNINKYSPFTVGSKFYVLPKYIQSRKAVINVQCNDECCFAWAIISAIRPAKHNPHRTSSYPDFKNILCLDNITFPMELNQISKFEKQNNMSINVYAMKNKHDWLILNECDMEIEKDLSDKKNNQKNEDYEILPVYISKNSKTTHINLLMAEILETNIPQHIPKYHFCWIKNLSRLVSKQMNQHKSARWLCDKCLSYFYEKDKLIQHKIDCSNAEPAKYVMPNECTKWLYFKNYKNKEMHPFVIYADLECLILPIDTCEPVSSHSYTNAYQKHVPCSISYYLKCNFDDSYSELDLYRGENCIEWFVDRLNAIAQKVAGIYADKKEMLPLTGVELQNFETSNICHICEREFIPPSEYALPGEEEDWLTKVKDHCHLTGKYRGAAHISCNLNYKVPSDIIIVFHNLQGYDAHFIIRGLYEKKMINMDGEMYLKNPGWISTIPINKEKYKCFTKYNSLNNIKLKFIDSYNFMSASLDKLSSYLEEYDNTKKYFKNIPEAKLKLLFRKGVLPYSYLNSFKCFTETTLPEKKYFFNNLSQTEITDSDYTHAQKVFKQFDCANLGEYTDLYLKTDVLLLADVFEQFRLLCKKTYDLDPANYVTAPGLSWDSLLKLTKIKLELLTDIDMLLFVERGIRGGISQCCGRYATANNRYMDTFDSSQPESYLVYLDAVNLYGWAMCQYLPTGNFKWLYGKKISDFNVFNIQDNDKKGYILEVDLTYPESLHDSHQDFPFCSENKIPSEGKYQKLLTTLEPKNRYVIHYRNLKQCLSHGLILEKIHRILEFDQSPWMRPYILKNTKLRMESTNEFEKSYFKLKNNSVFGKSMQNVRKMRDIKLVSKWEGCFGAGKLMGKPNFKDRVIFEKDFVAIELNRLKVIFNKPLYVGMAILDISKCLMYQFHYDYMKQKYESANLKLLYMDTDSLIYSIVTKNFYEDIYPNLKQWFDTSEYDENNPYGFPRINKKILGLFKDELGGKIMNEFVGLRSKMYSYSINDKSFNRAKGIGRSVAQRLTVQEYKKCLFEKESLYKSQDRIVSKLHHVYTVKQNKIALNAYDDKRYIMENNIDTLPWGHYFLTNHE